MTLPLPAYSASDLLDDDNDHEYGQNHSKRIAHRCIQAQAAQPVTHPPEDPRNCIDDCANNPSNAPKNLADNITNRLEDTINHGRTEVVGNSHSNGSEYHHNARKHNDDNHHRLNHSASIGGQLRYNVVHEKQVQKDQHIILSSELSLLSMLSL